MTERDQLIECTQPFGAASPVLDLEKYREQLEEFELTPEQENELLETLWHICRTFVEIGFGLDSVQNIFSGIVEKTLQEEAEPLDRKNHFKQVADKGRRT